MLIELDKSEIAAIELAMVSVRIRGGFKHSSDLPVVNFKQALQSKNADELKEEVEKENQRMVECNVWIAIKQNT